MPRAPVDARRPESTRVYNVANLGFSSVSPRVYVWIASRDQAAVGTANAQRTRMIVRSLIVAASLSGACLLACSSDAGGGTGGSDPKVCVAHLNPTPAELAMPVTTFEADVAPILAKSCAFASCHGSHGAAGNHGVFLAATTADGMSAVKAALVAPSKAMPGMPYVTPGNPDKSFLLHKLDETCK